MLKNVSSDIHNYNELLHWFLVALDVKCNVFETSNFKLQDELEYCKLFIKTNGI